MSIRWRFALLTLLLSAAASPSFADEIDELRQLRDSTISLVNALVEQGVLTRAKADAIMLDNDSRPERGVVRMR